MIKQSLRLRFEQARERFNDLMALLASAEVINNQPQFRRFAQEYAEIEPIVELWQQYLQLEREQQSLMELSQDQDGDLRTLAQAELQPLNAQIEQLAEDLKKQLLPKNPDDERGIFLEIRAGTGGDEAAIFAGDLYRMYCRYAERRGWQIEQISASWSEKGGFKEVIARLEGQGIYGLLKFESGAHRVQRVPVTESQGRIHTSACTVAIMPMVDELQAIEINPNELRVDTFRSSGAGGQHVNTTDSAIRITHLPTGIVVECQDERSQHKNRAKAMALLAARLKQAAEEERAQQQSATRRSLVGSGDRSERIRTYNFPQGRLTDHRINLTLYQLTEILDGNLDLVIEPLIQEYQAEQIALLQNQL